MYRILYKTEYTEPFGLGKVISVTVGFDNKAASFKMIISRSDTSSGIITSKKVSEIEVSVDDLFNHNGMNVIRCHLEMVQLPDEVVYSILGGITFVVGYLTEVRIMV